MSDLVERVEAALKDPGNSPWLPDLAEELAELGWQDLYRDMGLSPSNYGTARVMARDASAPRRIVARLPIALSADTPDRSLHVETLDEDFTRSYEEAGVKFYTAKRINGTNVLEQLEEAINILKLLPPLYMVAANLVKSIHLIDAGDGDHDVSFSEPHIPFTVFVSVPCLSSLTNTLRVTEALVHEAMHLQLTLVERVVALTKPTDGRYFSPWRHEYRTARGVLHALYVFRVIDRFFEESVVYGGVLDPKAFEHIRLRRLEISEQVQAITAFQDCPELTRIGADFVNQLLQHY